MSEMTLARRPSIAAVLVPGTAMMALTFGLARYGYGLLLPEMRADLGMSARTAGLVSSATYASYLVANVLVVHLSSRWGARVAVAAAAGSATFGMVLIAVADSVVLLAIGVLVAGAAAGLAFPPYADIVDRQVDPSKRDLVWSTISSGTGWGVALAGPIAILAGDRWRLAWGGFVVLAVVTGVVATRLAPARTAESLRRPQLSPSWFFCPRSGPLLISAVMVGAGSSVWWAFSVDAMQSAGLGTTPARVVYAVCGAAMLLGSVSGLAFARVGLRRGLPRCGRTAGRLARAAGGGHRRPGRGAGGCGAVRSVLRRCDRGPGHLVGPGLRRPSGRGPGGVQRRAHHRHPPRTGRRRHRHPAGWARTRSRRCGRRDGYSRALRSALGATAP